MQETARRGVAVERGVDLVGRQHGRQRQVAARDALGQADEIGADGGLLNGEHGAGAAETHGNLIGNQVHSIFRAQFPGPLEIDRVIHRHPCRALHQRFDDESGRFGGVLDQMRFQCIRTTQRKSLRRFACFGQTRIRRRYLHRVPQQGSIGGLEQRNIGH